MLRHLIRRTVVGGGVTSPLRRAVRATLSPQARSDQQAAAGLTDTGPSSDLTPSAWQELVSNLKDTCQYLKTALEKKDAYIEKKDAYIEERDARIKEKDARIKEKDDYIIEKEKAIGHLQTVKDNLVAEKTALRDALNSLEPRFERLLVRFAFEHVANKVRADKNDQSITLTKAVRQLKAEAVAKVMDEHKDLNLNKKNLGELYENLIESAHLQHHTLISEVMLKHPEAVFVGGLPQRLLFKAICELGGGVQIQIGVLGSSLGSASNRKPGASEDVVQE